MNPIKKLKARLTLERAVKMADEAYARTSERYYVMPSMDGKLVVMNRQDLKLLKRKGYVGKFATVEQIAREAFYFTPYRNGDGAMTRDDISDRKKLYYFWCAANDAKDKERRRLVRSAARKALWFRFKRAVLQLFDKF